MNLRALLATHGRVIGFGFLLALLSSFGQTTFISLSVPGIRAAFDLSNGEFGALYSVATLASGLLMIWAGGVIDRVSVRTYAAFALSGLCLAALSLSLAPNLVFLGLTIFALRLCGQGMLAHAAVTSTARLPQGTRGRAVGIATLGFPVGEAFLPGLGLALLAAIGWVTTWQLVAALLALALVVGFVTGSSAKALDAAPMPHRPAQDEQIRRPRRRDIIRDWRFLVFVPAIIAPPATLTGYIFHQRYIAEGKGWPLELLAASITVYAAASLVATLTFGGLVDRFGAIRLSRFHLAGLVAGSIVLSTVDGPWAAALFFACLGLSAGANNVVVPAVLAELFGTEHLGMIRALAGSLSVVASATTPGAVGLLFDRGITPGTLALGFAAYAVLASLIAMALPRR
jgi:MFS family permease